MDSLDSHTNASHDVRDAVQKRENLGLPPGDTDPFFDDLSDSEWQVCCLIQLSCYPPVQSDKRDVLRSVAQHTAMPCNIQYTTRSLWQSSSCVLPCTLDRVCLSDNPVLQEEQEPPELVAAREKLASLQRPSQGALQNSLLGMSQEQYRPQLARAMCSIV